MKKSSFLIILAVFLLFSMGIQDLEAQFTSMEITYPAYWTVALWECQQIYWTTVYDIYLVSISLSVDNGKTWQDVEFHDATAPEGTAWNDGYVTWMPPFVFAKHAIIRLSNPFNPDEYILSQPFVIRGDPPDTLRIQNPAIHDSYTAGSTLEITWTAWHYNRYDLDIEFSIDGQQSWSKICEQTNNDGYYQWRIPFDIESDDCYIKLYTDLNGWIFTDTVGPFTIEKNAEPTYFSDVSLAAGIDLDGMYRCVSWVDLNKDTYLDLFISGVNGYPNVSYINNQDGTFSEVPLQSEVEDTEGNNRATVFGDINNDGYPDLYLGGGNTYYDKLFLNDRDGTFSDITYQAGFETHFPETNGVAFLDYNLDGYLDIYVCKYGMRNLLYRNEGNLTFSEVSTLAGVEGGSEASTSAVAVGDYNRDRYPDLYVVNSGSEGNNLYKNNGNGTFSDVAGWLLDLEWSNSKTAEWGDLNNDGLLDLYVVRRSASNVLFQYSYSAAFNDVTDQVYVGDAGEGVVTSLGDFDSDGRQDICVGNRGSNGTGEMLLYLRNSEGTFDNVSEYSGLVPFDEPRGIASGDYDKDGDLDIFVVNYNGPSKLYKNNCVDVNHNNFLKVQLTGVLSNRDAIGTRILMKNGDDHQLREVQAGTGYGNTNSLELEFGLGSLDLIENMTIFWPSGIVQTLSDLLVNSLYCFQEIPDTTLDVDLDTLTVTHPITGSLMQSGTVESISWESTGNIDSVLLEYSINNGRGYDFIAITENDGLFNWTVPYNISSDSCTIRIADATDGSPADTSELFQIEIPIIPLHLEVSESEPKAGDSFWITLHLGYENQQVYSMMNLSGTGQFSLPEYVEIVTDSVEVGIMWGVNPWVDIDVDTLLGQFSFDFQRSGGEGGFFGFGEVVRILFRSRVNTPDSMEMVVTLDDLSLKDTEWTSIPTSGDSLTISIFNDGLIVWPGDTDNNGIVDQNDVLPLGLYWEAEGPTRSGVSIDWTGQKCVPWIPGWTTYVDGNGDGQVNGNDLMSIEHNWTQKHGDGTSVFPFGEISSNGKIYLEVGDHVPRTSFYTDILLSGESNLFGMGLTFCYHEERVEIDSVEMGSFWGDETVFLYSNHSDSGKVGIGISQKSVQPGQSGDGVLARVWMRVKDGVPDNKPVIFRIEDMMAINSDGEKLLVTTENAGFVTTEVDDEWIRQPLTFYLYANYPNPFNPSTLISYDIPRDVRVLLNIYDILGNEVRTLVNQKQQSGNYSVEWDGRNNEGNMVSSGIYIYKIIAGDHISTRKCMLMK